MMLSVPAAAPFTPPLTGESTKPQPRSAHRFPSAAASVGDIVTHESTSSAVVRLRDAGRAEEHLLGLLAVDDEQHDSGHVARRVGGGGHALPPARAKLVARLLAHVEALHTVALLHEPARTRPSPSHRVR